MSGYWFAWQVVTVVNVVLFWASIKNATNAQELLDEANRILREAQS